MADRIFRMCQINDRAKAIEARADAENRDFTEAESDEVKRLCDEYDRLDAAPPDAIYFAKLRLRVQ